MNNPTNTTTSNHEPSKPSFVKYQLKEIQRAAWALEAIGKVFEEADTGCITFNKSVRPLIESGLAIGISVLASGINAKIEELDGLDWSGSGEKQKSETDYCHFCGKEGDDNSLEQCCVKEDDGTIRSITMCHECLADDGQEAK